MTHPTDRRRGIEPALIEACRLLGLTTADLLTGRQQSVVRRRDSLYWLLRETTHGSWPEIARAVGRSNHATIHKAAHRAYARMADDAQYAAEMEAMKATILAGGTQ